MRRSLAALRGFLAETSGAMAAEFVLIIPVLVVLTLGTINGSFLLYAYARLHYAAQDAARCRSVGTTCTDDATTTDYALSRLAGPMSSPSFSRNTTGCGNTVQGTATYNVVTGLTSTPITMSAKACYPMQP